MLSRLPFMAGLILFEILADIGAKQFSMQPNRMVYAGVLLLYCIGNACWLLAMKHGVGLGKGSIIFGVLSTLITLGIAFLWYKEPVSTSTLIGAGFCVVGLFMIDWSS